MRLEEEEEEEEELLLLQKSRHSMLDVGKSIDHQKTWTCRLTVLEHTQGGYHIVALPADATIRYVSPFSY